MVGISVAVIGGDGIGPEVIEQAIGGRLYQGMADEVAVQTALYTRRGCERIMRAAFEGARKRRKKVTSITKSNALIYGMTLWDEVFRTVAQDYPDVEAGSLLVDAA